MKKAVIAVALGCCAGIAQADQGPKWDQVTLSYASSDFLDESLSGLGASGSKLISETLFLAASYSSISSDGELFVGNSSDGLELNELSLGLGFRQALSQTTDFFGIASYEKIQIKSRSWRGSESATGDGYGLRAGIRSMLSDGFELSAALAHISDGDESDNYLLIGANFFLVEQFSLGLGYASSSDIDTTSFSVSIYF